MSNAYQDYQNYIRPKARFDYRIKTKDMMIMSNGCAWIADLLDPQGAVVGTVENDGNGGADLFHFNSKIAEGKFYAGVFKSFGHDDAEAASWYMQELEEEAAE